ncbi:hypothetical protein BH23PLA1_BH23PLA1_37350 [soil metagenome]
MPERPIIYCMTTMHESGMNLLHEAGEVHMASALDPETLRREVVEADAIVTRTHGDIDADLMDCAPRLVVIGRHGVGYDQIDIPAATERGIQVLTTPGANVEAVVEHALAFLIGLSKHFPQQMAALNSGQYHNRTKWMGRDLTGRTLGIIGFGRIGKRMGVLCHQAFGMKVLYNDIVEIPQAAELAAGARRVELNELLACSEYITLHVPLDASTRRMIDRGALSKMQPETILINTCRGPVVDESAVAEALDAGRLWGYGADVFDIEPPPPDHPLVGRPDVMLTPHSAAQTVESLRNMASWVAEDVIGYLRGEPPKRPVNDPARVLENRRQRRL